MFASEPRRAVSICATLAAVMTAPGCAAARIPAAAPSRNATGAAPVLASRPRFDGEAALRLVQRQVDFGPRVPGTASHRQARQFFVDTLKPLASRVECQEFRYRDVPMANVIAAFGPAGAPRVLLCAHWDSRPRADMEVDAAKRAQAIAGANDGGSGVAVLLQLARMFKQQPPGVGVVMALLDGEDYGSFESNEGVLLGSSYLAKHQEPLGGRPEMGVLLDMVGGKDIRIKREMRSEWYARRVNELVFRAARDLGYGAQFVAETQDIIDDHVPLCKGGIPTIDLIDLSGYAPWHTLDDTPDKCSARSLQIVGETVAEFVYRLR